MIGPNGYPVWDPNATSLNVVRVLSKGWIGREEYYNLSALSFQDRQKFIAEMEEQGCIVQELPLLDSMPIMVAAKIREEMKAEETKAKESK